MRRWLERGLVVAGCLLLAGPVGAQDADRQQSQQATQAGDRIYGAELMTPRERAAYRERLRTMTPSERARFRQEHRRRMDQRARQRGVEIGPKGGQGPGRGRGDGPGGGGGR